MVSQGEIETERTMEGGGGTLPTGLSSMMPWALVRAAADIVALEWKTRRRNEMVGEGREGRRILVFLNFELKRNGEGLYPNVIHDII